MSQPLQTSWFTFGQDHVHHHGDVLLDKDIVVKITDQDPRLRMFELFGRKWAEEYNREPDLSYYPRGVIEL